MSKKINSSERQKGIIAIVILALLYGIFPLIPRYLSTFFLLFQQVYLRLAVAFLLSLVFFRKNIDFQKLKNLPLAEWKLLIFRAFSYYLLGLILYTQAFLLTKISNVAFIGAIPMTAILGFLILKERFTIKKALLVVVSFFGVVLVSVKDFSNIFVFGKGELFALASTFFFSLGLILRKWHSKILNDREIATFILFFATLFVFVVSLIKNEGPPLGAWPLGAILVLLAGGLLSASVSFLMNYGLSRIDAVLANNIVALYPVFATLLALIFYKEIPMFRELIGGILIISSAVLLNRLEIETSN